MKKIEKMPEGYKMYVKKPIPIKAIQISEPFEIPTLENKAFQAKAGDYLIEGVEGELYACDRQIFEKTYENVEYIPELGNLEIMEKVIEEVANSCNCDDDKIKLTQHLVEDLQFDELDKVELIMALEEEFNIEISDENADKLITVGDIVKFITNAQKSDF